MEIIKLQPTEHITDFPDLYNKNNEELFEGIVDANTSIQSLKDEMERMNKIFKNKLNILENAIKNLANQVDENENNYKKDLVEEYNELINNLFTDPDVVEKLNDLINRTKG